MTCDHGNMTSKFCPVCGVANKSAPLVDLLAHIRRAAVKSNMLTERYERWVSDHEADGDYERCRARAERSKAPSLKWASWVEALEAVVKASEDDGPVVSDGKTCLDCGGPVGYGARCDGCMNVARLENENRYGMNWRKQ